MPKLKKRNMFYKKDDLHTTLSHHYAYVFPNVVIYESVIMMKPITAMKPITVSLKACPIYPEAPEELMRTEEEARLFLMSVLSCHPNVGRSPSKAVLALAEEYNS